MRVAKLRRAGFGALLVGVVGVLGQPAAWAPHVAQLQVTPAQVRAGEQVSVFGPRGYGKTNPVQIRLDSETGPVLGSFQPDNQRFAQWGPGTVTIPADTSAGRHTLIATQDLPDADAGIRGIPARTIIEVLGPASIPVLGAPLSPAVGDRAAAIEVTEDEGVPVVPVLLVALGVAGVAMFAAGTASAVVRRRSAEAQVVGR
jgi:hypothetical protein